MRSNVHRYFTGIKPVQELQGKPKLNRAIPVCYFIRVLKNDATRLQGDKMLDLWLGRRGKGDK